MIPSAYNHLVQIDTAEGQRRNILTNTFFGSADFVSDEVFHVFKTAESTRCINRDALPEDLVSDFERRGYMREHPAEEEALVRKLGEDYSKRDEIAAGLGGGQYGFITSLYCNLACPYCFQQQHADSTGFLTREMIDKGLDAIEQCESPVRAIAGKETLPKIAITGGEPMLNSKANDEALNYLIEQLVSRYWPFNITTNGTELARFVDNHEASKRCRNVQVTLDGPRRVHNQRRAFRGGKGSFDAIVRGIDAALPKRWLLTLRVNLDMSNIEHLPELAQFILDKKWLDNKDFFAYLSPVTDHGAITGGDGPIDEADLLQALLETVKDSPKILEVFSIKHFRGFNYVERILDGNPRFPVLFRCEAATGMYIFDPLGDVHVCLESVGDRSRRVGTYGDGFEIDEAAHHKWSGRNVLTLPACDTCKTRFLCAGGCTLESFNKGDANTCMPFLREMDLAWAYFAVMRPEVFA